MAALDDFEELFLLMKEQEEVARLKRRWLMDLMDFPESRYQMDKLSPFKDKTILESFFREDDAYYDSIKYSVRGVLGVNYLSKEEQYEKDAYSYYSNYILKNLSSLLDNMTDEGLHCFAELLLDGFVTSKKKGREIKGIIETKFPTFLDDQNCQFQTRMKQIISIMRNSENFKENGTTFGSSCEYQIAAIKLLGGLEDLPLQALKAMHRRLNGKSWLIPKLGSSKKEQKHCIIDLLKTSLMTMLAELQKGGELPEPLIKALAIGSLTEKLIMRCPPTMEFIKFSPQIESLQNEIATAVSLVKSACNVCPSEIDALFKKLPHLDGTEVKLSNGRKRTALSNILMDFLYECSDMEIIPESLLEVVSYISKKSQDSDHHKVVKGKVEEEVELVFNFTAQMKQLVWDLVPGLEVDEDFANACMEDFKESDGDEDRGDLFRTLNLSSDYSKSSSESFGETVPLSHKSHMSPDTVGDIFNVFSPETLLGSKVQSVNITERNKIQPCNFSPSSCLEAEVLEKKHILDENAPGSSSIQMHKPSQAGSSVPFTDSRLEVCYGVKKEETAHDSETNADPGSLQHEPHSNGNKYLAIQKACDDTSMTMYHIIGGMIAEFAQRDQLSLNPDDLAYLQRHD